MNSIQLDAILRPFRAGHAGADLGEIELERGRVVDRALLRHTEESLRLEVTAECAHLRFAATCHQHVAAGFFVDREVAHRGAVLRRHVGNRGAVGQPERGRPLAEVLDELSDHLCFSQQLGDRQHEVGRRHTLA